MVSSFIAPRKPLFRRTKSKSRPVRVVKTTVVKSNRAPAPTRSKAVGMSKMFPNFTGQGPFPPVKKYVLNYSQGFSTTMTVGTTGTFGSIQKYNLNSLYDPDETAGGHQPYGYDALQIIYNRYKVNACKVELKIFDPSADGVIVGYMVTNSSNSTDTIAGTFPDTIIERQNTGYVLTSNTGNQVYNRKAYLPMYKAGGLTKLEFYADPDNFTAGVGGNPGNKIQLQVACADTNGGSTATIKIAVKLTFYATLFMRKVMAGS